MSRLALAALLLALGPASGPTVGGQLVAGPALAGAHVVWVERDGDREVLRISGAESLPRPANENVTALAASSRGLALARSYPGCAPSAGSVCPTVADVIAGRISAPLRPLAPPQTCHYPFGGSDVDVDGDVAAAVVADCDNGTARAVLRNLAAGTTRTFALGRAEDVCCAFRVAGRYAAWREGSAVVVRDPSRGARVLRVAVPAGAAVAGFDVDADARLVVSYARGSDPVVVVSASPADARPRVVARDAAEGDVRISGGRIAYVRRVDVRTEDVVVAGNRVARLTLPLRIEGGLDFDGARVAWASRRVDRTRVECGPPGSGRPCILLESGVTTLWTATLQGRRVRVAELPFHDAG